MSKTAIVLPKRSEVDPQNCWDLSSLYKSARDWETALKAWEKMIPGYGKFKGKLSSSATFLAGTLQFDADVSRLADRILRYAFLCEAGDQANSEAVRMKGRASHLATRTNEAASYLRPEIIAIAPARLKTLLKSPALKPWRLVIERVARYKPHTLDNAGEQLLAMQGQMADTASQVFRQLNDTDMRWGTIKNERGQKVELSHSSYQTLLHSAKREVRKEAFEMYYQQYDGHRNSLAAAYNGSVQTDVYNARVRKYKSCAEASLFSDNVPIKVYDNLVKSVRRGLPGLYRFYELRRKLMKLPDIHQYDVYVPILSNLQKKTPWPSAVKLVIDSLAPLGDEYCRTLRDGLTKQRWVDIYPNQGKQSGAFSAGGFDGFPYLLMNYQEEVLDHTFTLAHEAGHSMHSYFSARSQPYQYHDYVIFVAEVASTFNEQLLLHHLLSKTTNKQERAYLLNHAIDELRTTLIRQTMFAEFERVTHDLVEKGEPLTVDCLRTQYRKLLEVYFGPGFVIDPQLELECLRIPHFYRAFYVYKYATGLSAAIALSQKVLKGGARELNAYLSFLKGGCSAFPLDLLKTAGVDMSKPAPVEAAMARFGEMVEELDSILS